MTLFVAVWIDRMWLKIKWWFEDHQQGCFTIALVCGSSTCINLSDGSTTKHLP